MRKYDYFNKWKELLTPEIVSLLSQIHEYKGEQKLFIETKGDMLANLVETAKIQSTEASNKIEGISTSDERLKKLVNNKTNPKNRNEQEIAGYRDVLSAINESYAFIPVQHSIILQLHRDLYKFSGKSMGGSYRNTDNVITKEDKQGNRFQSFQPVPSSETSQAIDGICKAFDDVLSQGDVDPLLIIPMFILDFLCIHPFNSGNGRMSRLLTLLMLYRSDYIVGKYISIEKAIENTKDAYYESLHRSSVGWHDETNDHVHFVKYMLGVVLSAYREFSSDVKVLVSSNISKPDRIREIIKENLGKITKTEIIKKCPDIGQVTVQRTLNDLLKSGNIIKIGGGRYTSYVWNWEIEK